MKPRARSRKRLTKHQKHGLERLKHALRAVDGNVMPALDGRTTTGKALAQEHRNLVQHLGGEAAVSATQRGSVRVALCLALLIEKGMEFVVRQDSLVNGKRRAFYPVAGELGALLVKYHGVMRDLGYEPRKRELPSLSDYLAARATAGQGATGDRGTTDHPTPPDGDAPDGPDEGQGGTSKWAPA